MAAKNKFLVGVGLGGRGFLARTPAFLGTLLLVAFWNGAAWADAATAPTLIASPRGWSKSVAPGAVVQGNFTVQGTHMAASMVSTGGITASGSISSTLGNVTAAAGTVQGAAVSSTGAITAAGALQANTVTATTSMASLGTLTAGSTFSAPTVMAGSGGVTSSGSVVASGTVSGNALAGNLAGTYVVGAVALANQATTATTAAKAQGSTVPCQGGVVEGTDANGNFVCSGTINSANSAGTANQAAELTANDNCGAGTVLTVTNGVLGCASSIDSASNATYASNAGAASQAASVTGNVNGAQIVGDLDNVGNIYANGYVASHTGVYSDTGVYANSYGDRSGGGSATFNGTSTASGTSNYANSSGSANTAAYANASGTSNTSTYATTSGTTNAVASGAVIQGSQVSGAVASATNSTYAYVSQNLSGQILGSQVYGAVASANYSLIAGYNNFFQSFNSAATATGVAASGYLTGQQAAAYCPSGSVGCEGNLSTGPGNAIYTGTIGGTTYYFPVAISSSGSANAGGSDGAGAGGGGPGSQ